MIVIEIKVQEIAAEDSKGMPLRLPVSFILSRWDYWFSESKGTSHLKFCLESKFFGAAACRTLQILQARMGWLRDELCWELVCNGMQLMHSHAYFHAQMCRHGRKNSWNWREWSKCEWILGPERMARDLPFPLRLLGWGFWDGHGRYYEAEAVC